MEITNKQIADYCESFTSEEPEVVKELIKASADDLEFTDMLSGRQVGWLLKMLVQISGAKRILEAGTFTGYSALMMAEGMPDGGEIITIEMNRRYERISKRFFEREPYNRIIRQIAGNALEEIPKLAGPFDLIFLDADKIHYPEYYRLAKEKSRPGTLIVFDNMLWGGDVLTGADPKAEAIRRTAEIIRNDVDVEQVLLPVRDGVMVVRVRG
jgi:caffeoyl-CoA O-methyltransferase